MVLLSAVVTSVSKRSRVQIQEVKMSGLCRVRERSSVPRKEVEVELLLPQIERGPRCLLDASLERCSRHVPPEGEPAIDPGHVEVSMFLGWPGYTLESSQMSLRR